MTGDPPILLVDDDPRVLAELSQLLRDHGYDARCVASFQQAKQLLTSRAHQLLISNVRLGPFNGLQLARRARLGQPALATVLITDRDDPAIDEEVHRLGAFCVRRPIDVVEFLALVATLLAALDDPPVAADHER